MRVDVERTGGFAGRTVRWTLDVDALDADGQHEVHELLAAAPDWGAGRGPDRGADRFAYRLRTDGAPDGPGPLDLRFGDPLPEPARRLLDVVRRGPD